MQREQLSDKVSFLINVQILNDGSASFSALCVQWDPIDWSVILLIGLWSCWSVRDPVDWYVILLIGLWSCWSVCDPVDQSVMYIDDRRKENAKLPYPCGKIKDLHHPGFPKLTTLFSHFSEKNGS